MRIAQRALALATLLSASLTGASAQTPARPTIDRGSAVLAAQAACDGSLFRALATDAARWQGDKSFRRRGPLASFQVDNRTPPEPYGSSAMLELRRPRTLGGLPVVGWFDADLSRWSRFSRFEVQFLSWGFYLRASPEDIRDWLIRNAPSVGRRMAPSNTGKSGVYCVQERFENEAWVPVECSADEDFPTELTPVRWQVIRPYGIDGEHTVLSCELAGQLPGSMLTTLRPDLHGPRPLIR